MLHEYCDADDHLLCYVRRIEARNGRRKEFYPLTYGVLDAKPGWYNRAPDAPRPLYGLNRLSHAAPDATILLCEGEKAADAAMRLFPDHVCLAWMGGSSADASADLAPLRGRKVVLWPDADDPGIAVMARIAKRITARILDTTNLSGGFDAADLEASGCDDPAGWLATRLRAPAASRILTGADFIARHVPPVWLIDGIVQRSRLYACTSLTGHGKTAIWLFNSCMIHAGRMIGQLPVFKGNVLFLAGENPADLEARMIGMARTYNLPVSQLPYVLPGGFPMTEDEADALKRDIAGLHVPLALIVGDTASSFFPGDDENSNVQAGTYARTLRTFNECEGNPAIMALCHPTKAAARGNLLPRGGGAFLNELDGNLAGWSDSPGEVTELHWCGKIRGPDFAPLGYKLRSIPTGLTDESGRPEMTIIAEPMSEEAVVDHSKQRRANQDAVLRVLRERPGWSLAQIARHIGWIDAEDKPERWLVQRSIAALERDKLVQKLRDDDPWTLTEKGEKVLNRTTNDGK